MQGCLAPSEIPGISSKDASIFGRLAEDIIWVDFCSGNPLVNNEVFRDYNTPAGYIYFLAIHNPQFSQPLQTDYYLRLRGESMMRVPDFLLHSARERAFYEIKPDSPSGMTAGVNKVGILSAVYPFYKARRFE
jgi:hypothetical protein